SSPIRVVGGQAQFTYTVNGAGPHRFSALYSGDANCNGVDSGATPLVLTVRQALSAIGVPTSSGSTTFGQPLTFTAIVSALAPGSGTPSGIVTFKDGPTVLGIATLAAARASLTTSPRAAGIHAIPADAGGVGGADFAASTSSLLALVEDKAPTITILTVSQSAATSQTPVFTATVSAGGGAISGTVDFFDDGTRISAAPVPVSAGQAQFGPYAIGTGNHAITAQYSGDANNLASTSNAAPL